MTRTWLRRSTAAVGGLMAVALVGLVPGSVTHAAASALPGGSFGRLHGTGDGVTWAVSGTAFDSDTPTSAVTVGIAINGVVVGITASDPATQSWATTIPIPTVAGKYYVCVVLVNTDASGNNTLIGCKTGHATGVVTPAVTPAAATTPVPAAAPVGHRPNGSFGRLFGDKIARTWTVTGSMTDSDTPTSAVEVDVYVDGVLYTAGVADGVLHGYSITAPMPAVGPHYVCVYGLNTDGTDNNPLIGCKKGTVLA